MGKCASTALGSVRERNANITVQNNLWIGRNPQIFANSDIYTRSCSFVLCVVGSHAIRSSEVRSAETT
jgi:hypothetical protein